MTLDTIHCPCRSKSSRSSLLLCPACVQNALQGLLEQRQTVLEQRNLARDDCSVRLQQLQQDPSLSELAFDSQSLRQELARLRQTCGFLAVQVGAQVVQNEERRFIEPERQLESRTKLIQLQESLVQSAMPLALQDAQDTVKIRRFHLANRVFHMHNLQVGEEKTISSRHRHARGIGKIGGLPLPHAGPELYGVLPPQELSSALRLVASLTSTVSQCLGIVLPHPILLQPGPAKAGDVIETCVPKNHQEIDTIPVVPVEPSTSLMASITSLWSNKIKTPVLQPRTVMLDDQMTPSMDHATVAVRLLHAQHAVLAEHQSISCSKYVLTPSNPDDFAIGLQLLQNDIIALCIRAGVLIEDLWPAEALLLNLQALWKYSQKQVMADLS